MKTAVLLTGATGFLGTEIAADLIEKTEGKVYVLVRAQNREAAVHRLKAAWYHEKALYEQIGTGVIPVVGDFTESGLGLSEEDQALLKEEVGTIFHVGAETGLQKEEEELMRINREGTAHMLTFARSISDLRRFVYVSTAYVAGTQSGRIMESVRRGSVSDSEFSSLYEKSKAEAEALVAKSALPWTIVRPGMIVGNSKTGRAKNFNTIYYLLKLLLTEKLPVLPVDRKMKLNLVPVDYVARSAVELGMSDMSEGGVYHLTCPKELQPEVGEMLSCVRAWAKKELNIDLQTPIYAPVRGLRRAGLAYNKKAEGRKKNLLTNLLTLLPYCFGDQDFDRTAADALIGSYSIDWREYLEPMLAFAAGKNFMQQTERTVFEQACVRRESRHYPVTYHDVAADGIRDISGASVNRRVRRVKAALRAWGIRKGERIAMTGINCVDYMVLDQALGLIGAVTVPIYYTTPIEEVDLLLDRSGARWFFIGDKRIMGAIENLKKTVCVVAFSAAKDMADRVMLPRVSSVEEAAELLSNPEAGKGPQLLLWERFIAEIRVAHSDVPCAIGPDPDDLATIRYTSGTTGEPKGVMFNFHQLAWMGEVLTNLLSWKGRNREMRYLSFLPESHVVEGILASYAPYYMLAKVDFYFLNDFGALVDSLPKVRPTVFFSVPRFYEKLWDQLAANPIGQKYLTMPEGPAKKATAALLKTVILKKAGLDACEQLIVGSAPISEALLLNFRALGIEIHNAYGQTEAPLITINRLGDNAIPSIGTPLPETTVTVEPDGELIVAGPQVCLGYYGLETDTIKDGVLKTGDLGSVDEEGHIILYGRKKEMIITAYGKNISTPKIEERLKNIPAVSEAVLIGENRPYCTALLWVEGDAAGLDAAIEAMNADLSHPEQIRRYTIIEEPLSIARGELTPNLKVKRGNVEAHYREQIEEMYR